MMYKPVRFGGVQTREGFMFELSGGDIALDFVNTMLSGPAPRAKELLPGFSDLSSWSGQAGILSQQQETELNARAKRSPDKAEKARRSAVDLRECMFELFSHVAVKEKIPADTLKQWNRYVHRSMREYQLIPGKQSFLWKQLYRELNFNSMLWPVIHSAVELLTGPNALRIRRCAADNCDWLFLDLSKRGNRRWCDMTVCGNRAKAKRFYSKKKG